MLEAVERDPKVMAGWARKLLLVNVDAHHIAVRGPNVPLSARLAFIELLAKIGDAMPKQLGAGAATGPMFHVNIVTGGSKRAALPLVEVIEAEPAGSSVPTKAPTKPTRKSATSAAASAITAAINE